MSRIHEEHKDYVKFHTRSRLEKSINSLIGLIEGIAIDRMVSNDERAFLRLWLSDHQALRSLHPYSELVTVVEQALSDGVLTQDEHDDLVWLCERLRANEYFDKTTADMQRLHALLGGVSADGVVSPAEMKGLSMWLADHEHLRTCWPYDEIDSLIVRALSDGQIDAEQQAQIIGFCTEFIAVLDDRVITTPVIGTGSTLVGVCAIQPEIEFAGAKFCFTGASDRLSRIEFEHLIKRLGGIVSQSVSKDLSYLVIGAEGNPCWSYACYGRKVERAVTLRKAGARLLLVHENDFHDAVAAR